MSFPDIGDILGLKWRDNWQNGTVYYANDAVRDTDGQIYIALSDNISVPTSDADSWVPLRNLPSFSLTEEPFPPPLPQLLLGNTALDPSLKVGFHADVLADVTLTTSGYAVEGWLYTMALDGGPSADHTVTFGTGFVVPADFNPHNIIATKATMLLFIGHDTELHLVSYEDINDNGNPVLKGPYIVDYTDILHDGDTKTLWTPDVGDVLLGFAYDRDTWMSFNPIAATYRLGPDTTTNLASWTYVQNGGDPRDIFIPSTNLQVGVGVFTSTAPLQIRYVANGDGDLAAGHVEYYALVAKAIAP